VNRRLKERCVQSRLWLPVERLGLRIADDADDLHRGVLRVRYLLADRVPVKVLPLGALADDADPGYFTRIAFGVLGSILVGEIASAQNRDAERSEIVGRRDLRLDDVGVVERRPRLADDGDRSL